MCTSPWVGLIISPGKTFSFFIFFFFVISACLEHLSWLEPSNLSLFPNTSGFALGTILASVPPFKQSRLSCPHVCSWHSQPRRGPHTAPPSTVRILSPDHLPRSLLQYAFQNAVPNPELQDHHSIATPAQGATQSSTSISLLPCSLHGDCLNWKTNTTS